MISFFFSSLYSMRGVHIIFFLFLLWLQLYFHTIVTMNFTKTNNNFSLNSELQREEKKNVRKSKVNNSYRVDVAHQTNRQYGAIANTHTITHSIHFMPFDTRNLVGRFSSAKAHIFFIVNLFYLFCSIRLMMTVADWLGSANKVAVKMKPSHCLL